MENTILKLEIKIKCEEALACSFVCAFSKTSSSVCYSNHAFSGWSFLWSRKVLKTNAFVASTHNKCQICAYFGKTFLLGFSVFVACPVLRADTCLFCSSSASGRYFHDVIFFPDYLATRYTLHCR